MYIYINIDCIHIYIHVICLGTIMHTRKYELCHSMNLRCLYTEITYVFYDNPYK